MNDNDDSRESATAAFYKIIEFLLSTRPTALKEGYTSREAGPCVTMDYCDASGDNIGIEISRSTDGYPRELNICVARSGQKIAENIYIPIIYDVLSRKGWLDAKLNLKMNMLVNNVVLRCENWTESMLQWAHPVREWYDIDSAHQQ
jgi:hypothetical protein